MNLGQYRRSQDAITRQVVTAVVALLRPLIGLPPNPRRWRDLLHAVYPTVTDGRNHSFELARRFYLAQRPPHAAEAVPVTVSHYDRAALDHALTRTIRTRLSGAANPTSVLSAGAAAVARHVENAGREGMITQVRADPAALGWARVPTGRETCAFCWMLASRGHVYTSARHAGARANDRTALAAFGAGTLGELMNAWHDNCDCLAVPVFHRNRWAGHDTYQAARRLWNTATTGYSGRDALNAFRRALATGQLDLPAITVA